MINLPRYIWFIQKQGEKYITNIYTGSLGTDPKQGCINKITYNYRAFIKTTKEDGPISFHVEYFWRMPWIDGDAKSELFEKEFVASQEGINKAETWLVEQYLNEQTK